MTQKKRTYEVSIWTLQDEFISILKASNIEHKGQISQTKAVLKDDGTEEFSFSIPMYIYIEENRIENPTWQNVVDGTIIEDLRKAKLTFNKGTNDEETFEFIIVNVTERHEQDQLYCDVKCEGLAFHELGKIGYKISLSADDYYEDNYQWFENGAGANEPKANLQYWLNKFLEPLPTVQSEINSNKWYYTVEMNWDSYANASARETDIVYEEEYTGSWNYANSQYVPSEIVSYKEKERMIDLEESNIYNLTQDIANKFGVFCKYRYLHDENLHIIGKRIIFYNNYIEEDQGYLDLTYPYETAQISRNRDSKDVTTKMFVRPVEEQTTSSNLISIMDAEGNFSKEDYILDFDYLYKVGNITIEQYSEISKYEEQMRQFNEDLVAYENALIALYNKQPELEANLTIYSNSIQLDKERINSSDDLLNNITNQTGIISVTAANPQSAILLQSNNNSEEYYINITEQGVFPETVQIYSSYNFASKTLSDEIDSGVPLYDEYGNLVRITALTKDSNVVSSRVYLIYDYQPQLQYQRVKDTWTARLEQDEYNLQDTEEKLEVLNARIEEYEELYTNTLNAKNAAIAAFNLMMGPALRESYWQPEDYKDYGNNYFDDFEMDSPGGTHSPYASFIWDNNLFDDEQKPDYQIGSGVVSTCYYPVIDLSGKEEYIAQHIDELSFMFYDYIEQPPIIAYDPRNIRTFAANSTAQYGFARVQSGTSYVIKPVLIITNIETLTEQSRLRMIDSDFEPQIGVLTTEIENTTITTTIDADAFMVHNRFLNSNGDGTFSAITLVYPRIKIDSLNLRTSEDLLQVSYNDQNLNQYEDFYVLDRDDSTWTTTTVNNQQVPSLVTAAGAYYITIKPKVILGPAAIDNSAEPQLLDKHLKINYNISNASTAIYLDALQVMKENSMPKVSYEVKPSGINDDLLYNLYKKLRYICNINDVELQFNGVQGYISEITLDCVHEENDEITIKNYKTKFEDLFSTIVAQTSAMQKSAYTIGLASAAFNSIGELDKDLLQNSLRRYDLNYAFNDGKLTIDEKEGIWGTSDSGVVAFRGGGIFTATEKDEQGNWQWNTGIIPQGINADLITTGQLDTNLVRIYAGDKIRLQMNGDGLFAYKSIFDDSEVQTILNKTAALTTKESHLLAAIENAQLDDGLDKKQYVQFSENGLFLRALSGAPIISDADNNYGVTSSVVDGQTVYSLHTLNQDVDRVEISWDGLKLRNWNNDEVFYANADNGNLTLKGTLYADSLYIGWNPNSAQSNPQLIGNYISSQVISVVETNSNKIYRGADADKSSATNTVVRSARIGDMYIATNGNQYICTGVYDSTTNPVTQVVWTQFNTKVSGTVLSVDTTSGNINMTAGSSVTISGGSVGISGGETVEIVSNGSLKLIAAATPYENPPLTPPEVCIISASDANHNYIKMNDDGLQISSTGAINMSGGIVQIESTNEDSFIGFGEKVDGEYPFLLGNDGNIIGRTAVFDDLITLNKNLYHDGGINSLTNTIVISETQPSETDVLWVCPTPMVTPAELKTAAFTYTTGLNGSSDYPIYGSRTINITLKSGEQLPDNNYSPYTYNLWFHLYCSDADKGRAMSATIKARNPADSSWITLWNNVSIGTLKEGTNLYFNKSVTIPENLVNSNNVIQIKIAFSNYSRADGKFKYRFSTNERKIDIKMQWYTKQHQLQDPWPCTISYIPPVDIT